MSDTYNQRHGQTFYDESAALAEKWVNILDVRPADHSTIYIVEFRVTLSTGVSRWVKTAYAYPVPFTRVVGAEALAWLEAEVDKTRAALVEGRARFQQMKDQDRGE